jgi:hypothetical protein
LKGKVVKSTAKKAVVVRFDRESLAGFVQTPGGLDAEFLELLTPDGNLLTIAPAEAKAVCFVKDFDGGTAWPEHRAFATRPKAAGLWVRLRFRDGDSIEGILPNNLLLHEPAGFSIIPPDPTFQNQRIFVPRPALTEVQVLGVIGSPLRRPRAPKPAPPDKTQIEMFE